MDGQMNGQQDPNMASQGSSMNMGQSQKAPEKKGSDVGALIGIIIIIIVLVVGGLYFYGSRVSTTGDEQTDELLDVNSSDELDAIEEDLDNTDLEGLDSELDSIGTELESL